MKKIVFFLQNKGGCGKSVLFYLVAEKYLHVRLLDLDETTKTTSMQLRYRNPRLISFHNEGKMIDRGMVDLFFQKISSGKAESYIGDMGASISQQMPIYFREVMDVLPASLKELGLELEIYCVVAGSNQFVACMEYLMELQEAIGGQLPIKVFKNLYFPFRDEQAFTLDGYCKDHSLTLIPFNISESHVPSRQELIMEVLKNGEGVKAAPVMVRQYFVKAINALPDLFKTKN